MSTAEKQNGNQRTPWYSRPSAVAIFTIAGVGISLAALLLIVGLWILSSINNPGQDETGNYNYESEKNDPTEPESDATPNENGDTKTLTGSKNDSEGNTPSVGINATANLDENVSLSADTDFSQPIQGSEVHLNEPVDSSDTVYIVARRVILSEEAFIRAPEILIFSNRVTGGTLDVSGTDGTAESMDGSNAGTIYVLATVVEGVNIRAGGGDGFRGKQGSRGPNGQDGDCGGFGRWEPARRGGNGGQGGRGGRGGDGGNVRIVYGEVYEQGSIETSKGTGGEGGRGGDAGTGGDGCVGLGGAQSDAASGSHGHPGPLGQDGSAGSLMDEKKNSRVADILTWLQDDDRELAIEVLRYVRSVEQTNSKL